MRFALPRGLSDHQRVNHGYPKLRCRVEGCGSEFLFRHDFHNHERTHESKSVCDECGKSMAPRHLPIHIKIAHWGQKPYACMEIGCKEKFSGAPGLADHGRIAHGQPKLKCKFEGCGAEFSGYYEHRDHQRSHSKVECTECGKSVIKKNMVNHMRFVHQGERPYGCETTGCDKRYSSKIKVADHMRSMHGSPKLKCSVGQCTAEFVYKSRFSMHAKQHLS